MKRLVGFVHIEKAAGITLHMRLHIGYLFYILFSPKHKFGEFVDRSSLEKTGKLVKWQKDLVFGGHTLLFEDLKWAAEKMNRQLVAFTVMRDPVDRYLSHYNWRKNKVGDMTSFSHFLHDPQYNNYMVYRLSGERDNLEKAKCVIHEMAHIGFVDTLDSDMIYLNKVWNIKGLDNSISVNRSKKLFGALLTKEKLTIEQLRDVHRNNSLDMQLYAYAKAKTQSVSQPKKNLIQRGLLFTFILKGKYKAMNKLMEYAIQPFL